MFVIYKEALDPAWYSEDDTTVIFTDIAKKGTFTFISSSRSQIRHDERFEKNEEQQAGNNRSGRWIAMYPKPPDWGDDMPSEQAAGYLPGDPRYGLQGEALKDYYRTKAAQWAIYCWDKPGMADDAARAAGGAEGYVEGFGERVIGYGHFVSDDGRDTLGTSFFMQLDDRAAADKFVADEPMNKAGVYQRVEIHRWSNSFGKRAADYRRKGMQQFLCTGPKTGTQRVLPRAPARARILLRVVWRQLHLPRADPLGGWRGQYRHRAAARIAGPRGGGQVLERGAVRQERRVSEGCADHAVGVRGLTLLPAHAGADNLRHNGSERIADDACAVWVSAMHDVNA